MKHLSMKDVLREHTLRATPARIALAQFLHDAHSPVGTPTLTDAFVPASLDLATLYRTLHTFEEVGLVQRLTLDQHYVSYEWIHAGHEHHHHLVCKQCGMIEELDHCELERFEHHALRHSKAFSAITSHSLEFFGVCKTCARKTRHKN